VLSHAMMLQHIVLSHAMMLQLTRDHADNPLLKKVCVDLFCLCNRKENNIIPHLISSDLVPLIARFANCRTKRFSMMLTYLSSEPLHFPLRSFKFIPAQNPLIFSSFLQIVENLADKQIPNLSRKPCVAQDAVRKFQRGQRGKAEA
jgi:hypothetical protein